MRRIALASLVLFVMPAMAQAAKTYWVVRGELNNDADTVTVMIGNTPGTFITSPKKCEEFKEDLRQIAESKGMQASVQCVKTTDPASLK